MPEGVDGISLAEIQLLGQSFIPLQQTVFINPVPIFIREHIPTAVDFGALILQDLQKAVIDGDFPLIGLGRPIVLDGNFYFPAGKVHVLPFEVFQFALQHIKINKWMCREYLYVFSRNRFIVNIIAYLPTRGKKN